METISKRVFFDNVVNAERISDTEYIKELERNLYFIQEQVNEFVCKMDGALCKMNPTGFLKAYSINIKLITDIR